MVIRDKYHDSADDLMEPFGTNDAPPSYETIACGQPAHVVDKILPRQPATPHSSNDSPVGTSRPSSWLSTLSFSSRTSKQVRQTVLALIRDLVLSATLSADSPDLLNNCADACERYGLDFSTLLKEPSIEGHSAVYWGVLNRQERLLPSLLAYAAPLSQRSVSEIRLACLTTSNGDLFQSLRCRREPFTMQMTPLSTSIGADSLVLGSVPADEVSIQEMDGQGAFVVEMQINLWQKRMRVSGRVSVEFIARGRIWSLTFFSPPSTMQTAVGMWQVALCLMEHSPPTFIDSRLIINMPPSASTAPQASDLISLSPDNPSSPVPFSLSSSNTGQSKYKPNCNAPGRAIEVRLKSTYRLAYPASKTFLATLDAGSLSQKEWRPPHVEQWVDNNTGNMFTNGIIVPLDDSRGGELLYANTPFVASDGTLRVHLEARLEKPDSTDCVIC